VGVQEEMEMPPTLRMLVDYNDEIGESAIEIKSYTDPIIQLFNCFEIYSDWLKRNGYDKMKFEEYEVEYDKFRLKYDSDARYYLELLDDKVAALRGDTIISFYTPYKEMLRRATGYTYHKNRNPFDELIAKRNDPGFKEVNDKFTEFVEDYYSKGNFMLLPHREMNADRYRCSQDRIDKSLYECFPGGKLAKYFGLNDEMQLESLQEWIKEQNLQIMFEDGVIERDKIIPFNPENPYVDYSQMTDDELNEFLDKTMWFIKSRGTFNNGCNASHCSYCAF